ncbi:MAG: HAMP domain-containing histidine kinase, partial [Phycisphaerales bacterium]|nr:HAMP domain-containing histidine kinase [Phycisphaerales bacterium]
PMMSYAQLALQSPEDAELVERALHKAVDGTEKAARIAGSVLGFVRGDQGESRVEVAEAVADALSCLARDPEKDGIEITVEVPEDLTARMPAISLQQVLLNLILNSRQAIRPHAGTIRISAACSTWNTDDQSAWEQQQGSLLQQPPPSEPEVDIFGQVAEPPPMVMMAAPAVGSPVVRITVEDSGCGIDPDNLELIFRPYVSERADRTVGTGLGLPICRQLISQAAGTITASSVAGQGSTFEVVVPLAD